MRSASAPNAASGTAQTASVDVTLIFEDGTTAVKNYAIAGNRRFSVPVAGEFQEAQHRRFGAVVESMPADGGQSRAQIVVERSVYSDAAGLPFAAGANAPGTKLR